MLAGRFPLGYGVAGRVAQTGETLNLVDAYRSKYFSPSVDQAAQSSSTNQNFLFFFWLGVMEVINLEKKTDERKFH